MSYIPTTWVDGETPVNAENLNKLEQGVADIHAAKENGELDGTPGKSAYQYALDGGYTGTEADFAKKLAQEYPSKVSQLENDRGYITSEDIPDIPAGSGIHIGSEPPEDENVTVWIDTDEEPEASGGAKPYVIDLTGSEELNLDSDSIITTISYDEFAQHWWDGGILTIKLAVAEMPVTVYPSIVNVIPGQGFVFSFFSTISMGVVSVAFTNGTWTPPTT